MPRSQSKNCVHAAAKLFSLGCPLAAASSNSKIKPRLAQKSGNRYCNGPMLPEFTSKIIPNSPVLIAPNGRIYLPAIQSSSPGAWLPTFARHLRCDAEERVHYQMNMLRCREADQPVLNASPARTC